MAGHILIVDDHAVVRRGLRTLLSSRPDWQICGEASDGVEAIEAAKALRPDVVLMDISMPRMNGIEAARVLRSELPGCKVIIISQNDPLVARRQAQEVDAAAFVAKSDLSQQLLPTLARILAPRERNRAPVARPASSAQDWLAGGRLGDLIREHAWSTTPLGPIELWPQSLKTSVNLILNSQHPMWIGWGPAATFLYNDAYIQVLSSAKHPWALGKPAAEVWPEIWDICGPLADKVFQEGRASFVDDIRLFMNRGDFLEETYYSFSYSPIRDESGVVAGLFCPSTEVTPKVVNARRLRTLSDLSHALVQKTVEAACDSAMDTLRQNSDDIPFALLYLLDEQNSRANLLQVCRIPMNVEVLSPKSVALAGRNNSDQHCVWPLVEVLKSRQSQVISVKNVKGLPLGLAQQPLSQAMVLSVSTRPEERAAGVLVVGVSPARKLDAEYRTFYELVAGQIATAIQNARSSEEEKKRLEALAEIDRAKTAFFSNVSHEFRTPLTLMLGPVEELLARSHTDLTPAAKTQLELVNRNGSRLLRLVNTLLDFSRIEAGRMQAIYQPTDLAGFTVELASVFRSATERACLSLEIDCPKLAEPVFVDRGMWEKIVLNLISNAFKFTFEGKIAVTLTQVEKSAELRVRDTGVGIPAQEIPRLFDRFHRIENTRSRTHEGSGIGLALVLELVKLHGGSVRAESTPGEGSTFIVNLPLGSAHLPADRIGGTRSLASTALGAAPYVEEALRWLPEAGDETEVEILPADELLPVPCPPMLNGDTGTKRPYILVADDNSDMRHYLVRLLAERYEVKAVPDGELALAAVRERTPVLLLSDVMMPNLDGFGLLHTLRSDPQTRTLPIILLSARAGEESRVEGMEQGADDYLIKPFSARELLARVQTHLEMARVRRESEEALRRRTEQFETLFNQAPLGCYLVDNNFRIRAMNPPALKAFGDVPDINGRDFDEVVHLIRPKAYADQIVQQFRHTLETGEPYLVPEGLHRSRNDAREIFEWQINRIPLPEGGHGVVCYFRDITRQVMAREAIAESEQRLRLATEAAQLGIWHWYPNGDRSTWDNDRMFEIFGRTREDGAFSETEFRKSIVHPEDAATLNRALTATLETGIRLVTQGRIRRKDGEWRWVEITGQLERHPDGSPVCIQGTVLDITERMQAEQILRQQRRRFDLVADAANVGFWFCDLPFDRLTWDNRVKEHFWLPPDADVTIDTFYERIHPDDRERTRQAIAESNEHDLPYDVEYRTVAPDGREKWVRALGRTFYDRQGRPRSFDGLTLDITERKKAGDRERQITAEAVAANAKFRAVFEQTTVFAGIMTNDGVMIDANKLCLEACGFLAKDVLGRLFWECGWWRDFPKSQEKIRAATPLAAQGIPYREVLHYSWADGTERLVEFALYPIVDHEGKVIFLHPTGVDITELKHAEERYRTLAESLNAEVRARTSELEQRNTEVVLQSDLLRDLSSRLLQTQDEERRRIARELHDSAGQILTALGISLSQLAREVPQGVPEFARTADDCQRLVQDLSREIRTTSYLLHPPLLDEIGLPEALRWYIEGLSERSGLDISLNVPGDFGRLPRQMELAMFRLVQECLTNIHRHSGSKTAFIRMARNGETVSLEVQDEGRGIPADKLARIQAQGSGVGIRGMRERVRQFDGTMNIDSNGSGTTISFRFPVSKTSPPKGEITTEPLTAAT